MYRLLTAWKLIEKLYHGYVSQLTPEKYDGNFQYCRLLCYVSLDVVNNYD